MRRLKRRQPRRSSSTSCASATGRRRWARSCAACGSPRALSKWLLVAALAPLALRAFAQEAPEAEAEQALPPIFAPERPPSAEQERPPTGQPDPAGILQQDRSPREAPAPLPQDRALML